MILVIDNYDSFVHNLARYLRQLGCETLVVRNDRIHAKQVQELAPQAIVLSPGPCTPDEAGCSIELVKQFSATTPMLGICLGHQAIVQALGGTIGLANEPVHGRPSQVVHSGSPMFRGIPKSFMAGRYHSLVANVAKLPDQILVTARTEDGTIMAVEHQTLPLVGLQFHPESILTECGYLLLVNFLKIAGIEVSSTAVSEVLQNARIGNANWISSPPIRSSRLSTRDAVQLETETKLP